MDLEEIEAIRQVKYRYFRLLDTKRFTDLGSLLTDDATTSYQSGELSFQGRDAIVAFAGSDIERAVYYPEDDRYLLTRPDHVRHFDATVPNLDTGPA